MKPIGLEMQPWKLFRKSEIYHKYGSLLLKRRLEDLTDESKSKVFFLCGFSDRRAWANECNSSDVQTLCSFVVLLHGERSWHIESSCRWGQRSWWGGPLRRMAASAWIGWPRSCSTRGSTVKRIQREKTVYWKNVCIFLCVLWNFRRRKQDAATKAHYCLLISEEDFSLLKFMPNRNTQLKKCDLHWVSWLILCPMCLKERQ